MRWQNLIAGLALTMLSAATAVASESQLPLLRLTAEQVRTAGIATVAAKRLTADKGAEPSLAGARLSGQVMTPNDIDALLAVFSGQLQAVLVHPGETVRAGQALARIHSAELVAQQREFVQAHLQAQLADAKLKREQALFEDGIVAESRLNEARAARAVALASRDEQRQVLVLVGMSERAIDMLASGGAVSATVTVTARSAGVVLEQPAMAGTRLDAGDTVMRLAPLGTVWLQLQASDSQARELSIGDTVSVASCEQVGRVIGVGTQLDSVSQTVAVRAEIPDGFRCLRTNQYVEAAVRPASVPAGLVDVPLTAVVRHGGREYVFVQEAGGFRPTLVTVMRRLGDRVWLSAGVDADRQIANGGLSALKGAWFGLGVQADAQTDADRP